MLVTSALRIGAPQCPAGSSTMADTAQALDWVVVSVDDVPAAVQKQAQDGAPDGVDQRGWHNRSTRFWARKPSTSAGSSTAGEGPARGEQQQAAAAIERPADAGASEDGDARDVPRSRPRRRAPREDGRQQQRRCGSSGGVAPLVQPLA